MKTLSFLLVLLFFISCSEGKKYPSREVLKMVAAKSPEAEKVSIENLKFLQESFIEIKQNKNKFVDLQDSITKSISKMPEYESFLSFYTAEIVNDTTLYMEEFDPVWEKASKDSYSITLHARKYIFHKNGDIELLVGNLIKTGESDVVIRLYVDGETGLIVEYQKKDFASSNFYKISKEGVLDIGSDYGSFEGGKNAKIATKTFNFILIDVKNCLESFKKMGQMAPFLFY